MYAKSLQWCPTLCDPVDCSLPDSSVHGILQIRTWSGLLYPPPGDLRDSGIKPTSSALAGGFFATSTTWEAHRYVCNICHFTPPFQTQ